MLRFPFLFRRRSTNDQHHNRPLDVPVRKIRSAEPDLKIIIDEGAASYEYYSIMMAHHSHYIDNLLAEVPSTTEISFPDIQSGVWELMVACLAPTQNMTVTDVYLVFPFYVKYQFEEGLKICDKFIEGEIERTDDFPVSSPPLDAAAEDQSGAVVFNKAGIAKFIELRVRYFVDFADLLPMTKKAGLDIIEAILHDRLARIFFSWETFKMLLVFVEKEERLQEIFLPFLEEMELELDDLLTARRRGTAHLIFRLLRAHFKVEYARADGCMFPDEQRVVIEEPPHMEDEANVGEEDNSKDTSPEDPEEAAGEEESTEEPTKKQRFGIFKKRQSSRIANTAPTMSNEGIEDEPQQDTTPNKNTRQSHEGEGSQQQQQQPGARLKTLFQRRAKPEQTEITFDEEDQTEQNVIAAMDQIWDIG